MSRTPPCRGFLLGKLALLDVIQGRDCHSLSKIDTAETASYLPMNIALSVITRVDTFVILAGSYPMIKLLRFFPARAPHSILQFVSSERVQDKPGSTRKQRY
jgi:hypothetical protein